MTRKLRAVIPAILCVALAASACSKKEETPTFTGDKTEEPSYQANLDFVTPAAYSNIQGLNLDTAKRALELLCAKNRRDAVMLAEDL